MNREGSLNQFYSQQFPEKLRSGIELKMSCA